jgi:hypothetical protein
VEPSEALQRLNQALTAGGFETGSAEIAEHVALVGRRSDFRWRWFATRVHTFVVAFTIADLREEIADELTAAAQQYSIDNKGGLPRGLQTGTATIAVFVTDQADAELRDWFKAKPRPRFAALRFPVLVELQQPSPTYFQEQMALGRVYLEHVRHIVDDVIAPAVKPRSELR